MKTIIVNGIEYRQVEINGRTKLISIKMAICVSEAEFLYIYTLPMDGLTDILKVLK